ncbi:hypothetical protein ABPG77_001564 [Micractinium sp. CCAP 211/92]
MDQTAEPSTSSSVPDAERVLAALRTNGKLEQLRTAAIKALEQDAELRAAVERAVVGSRALRYHQGDKLNKALVTELQSELSDDLSAEALRCLWSVLQGGDVSRQIDEAARRVLCQQHAEQLQAMASGAKQQQQARDQQQQQRRQASTL